VDKYNIAEVYEVIQTKIPVIFVKSKDPNHIKTEFNVNFEIFEKN